MVYISDKSDLLKKFFKRGEVATIGIAIVLAVITAGLIVSRQLATRTINIPSSAQIAQPNLWISLFTLTPSSGTPATAQLEVGNNGQASVPATLPGYAVWLRMQEIGTQRECSMKLTNFSVNNLAVGAVSPATINLATDLFTICQIKPGTNYVLQATVDIDNVLAEVSELDNQSTPRSFLTSGGITPTATPTIPSTVTPTVQFTIPPTATPILTSTLTPTSVPSTTTSTPAPTTTGTPTPSPISSGSNGITTTLIEPNTAQVLCTGATKIISWKVSKPGGVQANANRPTYNTDIRIVYDTVGGGTSHIVAATNLPAVLGSTNTFNWVVGGIPADAVANTFKVQALIKPPGADKTKEGPYLDTDSSDFSFDIMTASSCALTTTPAQPAVTSAPTATPIACTLDSQCTPYTCNLSTGTCNTPTPVSTAPPAPCTDFTPPKAEPIIRTNVSPTEEELTITWENQKDGMKSVVEMSTSGGGTFYTIFSGVTPKKYTFMYRVSNILQHNVLIRITAQDLLCTSTTYSAYVYIAANPANTVIPTSTPNLPPTSFTISPVVVAGGAIILIIVAAAAILTM